MDTHFDHKIYLNDKSEYEGWSLSEIQEDNTQSDTKYVPWVWSAEFTATELRCTHWVNGEADYDIWADDEVRLNLDTPPVVGESERIYAVLRPGSVKEGRWSEAPVYSMFGTDRYIEEFYLSIHRLPNEESSEDEKQLVERCKAWSITSYTSEIDFRYITKPDQLGFNLFLKPSRFDHLAKLVRNKQIDEAYLQVSGVSGFYSVRSPSITTDKIKVLESYSEVVLPEGCEIVPPRMAGVNNVSEFTLGLTSTANKNLSAYFEKHRGEDDREPDENDFETDETQSQRELEFSSILQQIAKVEAATRKLQLPLWVGAIALIVLANLIA